MKEKCVMDSKVFDLWAMDEDGGMKMVHADFSIACEKEKYGLIHNTCTEENDHYDFHEETLILPYEYDHLFFLETDGTLYLLATVGGKKGLMRLDIKCTQNIEYVQAVPLLPCAYDHIEVCKKNTAFFLYRQSILYCYDPIVGKIRTDCDSVEEICEEHLFVHRQDVSELWNTFSGKKIATVPREATCCYLGNYEQGYVIKLCYQDKTTQSAVQQLLFCEFFGCGVLRSPKAACIIGHTRMETAVPQVVGIEMVWREQDSVLSGKTVEEITKTPVEWDEITA